MHMRMRMHIHMYMHMHMHMHMCMHMCMCMRMRMCICYVATRPHVHSPCHKPRAPVLRSQTSTSEKIVTNVANGSQKAPATIGNGVCSRAYPACNRTSPAMSNIL